MFGWLTQWFKRRTPAPYTEVERLIFRYHNGEREVQGDPIRLWKRVMAVGPMLRNDLILARSPSQDAEQGYDEATKKIRDIFVLKSVANDVDATDTLTDTQAHALFDRFMEYAEELKKKSSQYSTSPNSSAVFSSGSPPAPATSSLSASGSAANVPSTAAVPPPPPPTASPFQPKT